MIDPSLLGLTGTCVAGLTSVVLVYVRNKGALNLKKADNKVVSEQLFRDELKKRDDAIYNIEQEMKGLTDKYTDQRERDLTEIELWKDKYKEQVEINSKLQNDFETLKNTVTKTAMQATDLINNKVEEIKNI